MAQIQYIWTNHALTRLKERKIPQSLIDKALRQPDRKIKKNDGSIELQKKFDKKTVAAIIKKNNTGEKIIVSCWINPPYAGTKDYKKRARYFAMQNGSFVKKLWLTLLNQLGL